VPFLTGYGLRKAIKYGSTLPASNLTAFPKLVKTSADADITAELSGGGGVAVTLADGTTTVPFGLYPSSAPASGTLTLRAKFDLSSAASAGDVLGYLYYDHTQTTSQNRSGVVSDGFQVFAPMEEDPTGGAPQIRDWVSDTLLLSASGFATGSVTGKVGSGVRFENTDSGTNKVTATVPALTTGAGLTVSCWFSPAGNAYFSPILLEITGGAFDIKLGTTDPGGGQTNVSWASQFNSLTAAAQNNNTWLKVDFTQSGANIEMFFNGASVDSDAFGGTGTLGTALQIGRHGTDSARAKGDFDELKVVSGVRSANYLAYDYQDEANNSSTFTLGAEEVAAAAGQPAQRRGGLAGLGRNLERAFRPVEIGRQGTLVF
jgi:hypothetical protein